jgi:hypothetical protein
MQRGIARGALAEGEVFATSTKPPPGPRVESRPPSPGRGFLWTNGYFVWHGQRAEWRPGHWEALRPGFCYDHQLGAKCLTDLNFEGAGSSAIDARMAG